MAWEYTEKGKKISDLIEQKIKKVNKDSNEHIITISFKIKFIDSARFMERSLTNLVDNFAEEIDKFKCKDCNCFLEYQSFKENLIKNKCLSSNKDFSNKIKKNKNMIQEYN